MRSAWRTRARRAGSPTASRRLTTRLPAAERRGPLLRERAHPLGEVLGVSALGDRLALVLHLGLEALRRRLMEEPLAAPERQGGPLGELGGEGLHRPGKVGVRDDP